VAPAAEVVRLTQVAVAAPAAPTGLAANALDVSAGILLVRVTDSVGVRGEPGVDSAVPADRVFVQAQSPAALQQLARLALIGVTSAQETGDDPAPAAELAAAPAPDAGGEEQPATPAPAPPPALAAVRGMPSSPLDALFALNPLLNRLGSPAAGGAAVPASVGLGGFLAGVTGAGNEGRRHGWLDAAAWVSACAALALASWGVVSPALRRRPDEADETASLLT
jgi:hypothetical protein